MTRRPLIRLCLGSIFALTACAGPRSPLTEQPTRPTAKIRPCVVDAPAIDANSCERDCAEGNIASCILVGRRLALSGEAERAAAFLDLACYENSGASCALLADLWSRGDGLPIDFVRAAFYHRRACESGAASDCHDTNLFVGSEDNLRLDAERLAAFYAGACDQGFEIACFNLGLMIDVDLFGIRGSAPTLYRQACAQGDSYTCEAFGERIARAEVPLLAATIDRNRIEARQRQHSCQRGAGGSCAFLSIAQEARLTGDGVAYAPPGAASAEAFARAHVYATACRLGHGAGCYSLAKMYSKGGALPQDGARVEGFYRRACTVGDVRACLELQQMLETPQPLEPAVPVQLAVATPEAAVSAPSWWE